MKLSMTERLLLLNILPEQGDVATIRVVHDLRQKLAPSDKEYEECGFFTEEDKPNMLFWDKEKETQKEMKFSKAAQNVVKKSLLKVSDEEQVTAEQRILLAVVSQYEAQAESLRQQIAACEIEVALCNEE